MLAHPPIRLMLVDDDPDVLEALVRWCSMRGYDPHPMGCALMAEACLRQARFDVVVTDLAMPGIDGLQLLTTIKEIVPDMPVIFLTAYGSMEVAIEALREGRAFDFLHKPLLDFHRLSDAIDRAAGRPRAGASASRGSEASLTEREWEIVSLLSEGHDNRSIAGRLCISEKTVKAHLTHVYGKLGVKGRMQAVLAASSLPSPRRARGDRPSIPHG